MIVDIMVSCTADHVFPQTVNNMVNLLERLGDTPEYNTAQVCCGYPLYFGGYCDEARVIGEKFINTFYRIINAVFGIYQVLLPQDISQYI